MNPPGEQDSPANTLAIDPETGLPYDPGPAPFGTPADNWTIPRPAPPLPEERLAPAQKERRLTDLPSWLTGHARPFWVGVLALALALAGQAFLRPGDVSDAGVIAATVAYGLAVLVLLRGWRGSYANLSLPAIPRAALTSIPVRRVAELRRTVAGRTLRLGGALLALSLTIFAVRLLRADPLSPAGLLLWIAGLAVLLLATLGERAAPAPRVAERADDPAPWRIPPLAEAGVVLAILALALALRLWRLDDLAPGLHGDEGEAGLEALKILSGQGGAPFATGWFNQSNVYFGSIALGMHFLGDGLAGLRAFAVICGLITVLFVYLCAREMFGLRSALVAGLVAAFGSADLFLSRHEFGVAAIPALITLAFYCILRGLRTKRHAPFVVAGFAAGLCTYYMATGWLVAVTVGAFLGYLLVAHRDFLGAYGSRLAAFALAVALVAAPGWADSIDHPIPPETHPNGAFIWSQYDRLEAQYGTHGWPGILWEQLTHTLALITHRADGSTLGALDYPPLVPFQAAFVVLGLAWAAWRFRDTRFALLSIWFWVPVLLGGVPAAYAPNLPRIAAALPVLALVMAAVLDHLAAPIPAVVSGLERRPELRRTGGALAALVVAGVVVIIGAQQAWLFFGYYLNTRTSAEVTGQAQAVRQAGPAAWFYDLGAPSIYWDHGANRFVNPTAQGRDIVNPADDLPILDNGPNADQDAVFLVWNGMRDYLWALYAYYPGGIDATTPLSDSVHATPALITYTVPREEIDKYRVLRARYQPAGGPPVERLETSIGLGPGAPPPDGLAYPVAATWDGGLVAPAYQAYGFELAAPPGSRLTIDEQEVLTVPPGGTPASARVTLARGPHTIHLAASLAAAGAPVDLRWTETGGAIRHIARRYLWDNHIGRGWLGEIRPLNSDDPLGEGDTAQPGAERAEVESRRIDGFLGFRDTAALIDPPRAFTGVWTGVLNAPEAGTYGFALTSNGDSRLTIDGQVVVDNADTGGQARKATGSLDLPAGPHTITLRYAWQQGTGVLDCAWTPPGQPAQPLLSPDLTPPTPLP